MTHTREWRLKRNDALQKAAFALALTVFFCVILFFFLSLIKFTGFGFKKTGAEFSFNKSTFFSTVIFTLAQALCSTLLALLFGMIAAYFVSHRKFALRKFLLSLSAIPLCVPAIVVALGYISTFGISGVINRTLVSVFNFGESPLKFLYSFWGLVICQGFYNFPLVMLSVSRQWLSLDTRQQDCARLLGAGEGRIFFGITLNQLLPGIFSSCIPVFIYSFFSFMIAGLFAGMDGTTLELALYQAAKAQLNYRKALVIAFTQTTLAFAVLFIYSKIEHIGSRQKETSLEREKHILKPLSKTSGAEKFSFAIFIIIAFIFFIMPFACILILSFTKSSRASSSFTFEIWKKILSMKSFWLSIRNTVLSASCTALFATATGFVYALFLRTKDPMQKNHFLKIIPLLPMAVSSVMLGLGSAALVKRGNFLLLILAQTSLIWPFAFRQIYASMVKIPEHVFENIKLLDTKLLNGIFRIILPYSKKSVLSTIGLCFALSAGDASLPLTLSLRKFDTLALFTYRLAGSYRLSEACCSGIVLAAICMMAFSFSTQEKFNLTENKQ